MKDDSLSDVNMITQYKYDISIAKQENVYAKQIWNDAIEAAAKIADSDYHCSDEIRKLKK